MKRLLTLLFIAGVITPTFAQDGSISGIVRDANTLAPIMGAHVVAQGPSLADTYTDSIGSYQIIALNAGPYVVEASAFGYEPALQCSVIVIAGQNTPNVNFWLYPLGGTNTGIAGTVTNVYTNEPILGAIVTASGPAGSGSTSSNYYGEYFIQNLAAGFYEVNAWALGFVSEVYPDSVEVISGQITQNIDFALVPLDTIGLGGISGKITSAATGLPILCAQVLASGPNGQGFGYSDSSGTGFYIIDDLPEGKYEVRTSAVGYYPSTYPESVVVSAGQITPNIDFALTPCDTGGIGGFVLAGETGYTIAGAEVTATGPSGTIQVQTNSFGDYLVSNLSQGVYSLHIEAAGYEPNDYPEAILVQSGTIESFVVPVLFIASSVKEQSPNRLNGISFQTFPKPFTKQSIISWQVLKGTKVRLTVFDVAGRLVKNLLDSSLKPGSYSLTWDGRDERGINAPKGIYLYRLEIDGINTTTKTILLK